MMRMHPAVTPSLMFSPHSCKHLSKFIALLMCVCTSNVDMYLMFAEVVFFPLFFKDFF